jgi:hypothetical protein
MAQVAAFLTRYYKFLPPLIVWAIPKKLQCLFAIFAFDGGSTSEPSKHRASRSFPKALCLDRMTAAS